MNELVNFARQALERRSDESEKEPPSVDLQMSDWLSRWRGLATATSGLLPDDPRVDPALRGLANCDRCYRDGDLDGFRKGAERVRWLMQFAPGATVRWKGSVDHRLCLLGPATVEHVHHDDGKLYVFVVWKDLGRWVSEAIITTIEEPTS